MFFKKQKKIKKKEIKLVLKKGNILYNNYIKTIYKQNNKLLNNKITIIVPKKNIKKSVKRNKIKRRIRNSYKNNELILNKKKFYFIIFLYINKNVIDFKNLNKNIIKILIYINLNIKNEKKIFSSRIR
ncbi:MAG: ribonuclease P protein component [Candidatus Shikimatogenerans bostrichidophilus]|nr:MAG: ribonuclease P protein component [Candidatus Shikimatogenerans bostrichidophilus]